MKKVSLLLLLAFIAATSWAGQIEEDGYYKMDSLELSGFDGALAGAGELSINGAEGTISGIQSVDNSWWIQFAATDMSKLPTDLTGATGWKLPVTNTSAGGLQLILVVSTAINSWQAGSAVWLNAGDTGTMYVDIEGAEEMQNYFIIASVPADYDVLTFTALDVEDKSKPWSPSPVDDPQGEIGDVVPELFLTWNTPLVKDPNERPNPDVKKHYIFGNFDNPGDPNLFYVGEIDAGSPVTATAQYPAVDELVLDPLTTYRWQIVEGLDDGEGGVRGPDDPNNIIGNIWTFMTASFEPIITGQPTYQAEFPAANAVFSTEFFSLYAISANQWFWSGDNGATYTELADGAHPSGSGSTVAITIDEASSPKTSTLTISDLAAGDDGWYYCVVTNSEGTGTSDSAGLAVKRQVANYKFEGDLTDSSGEGNTGVAKIDDPTLMIDIAYDTGIDGQALLLNASAGGEDPNQTYIELPASGYPNAGPGGAMEAGTIIFWYKSWAWGRIMGSVNADPDPTAFYVSVDNNFDVYVNGVNNIANNPAIDSAVTTNEWQFAAARWQMDNGNRAYVASLTQNGISSAVGVAPELASFNTLENPMLIGAQNWKGVIDSYLTNAMIDELQIYNYTLTDAEIAAIYNSVSGQGLCVADYAVAYDFNGDCIVSLSDFAVLANNWLDCGILPDTACGN